MYHFTDGDLTHIWLENGYREHQTPYGKAASIHDMDGLIRAVCLALVNKPHKLTGKEFRYLRQSLLLPQGCVASLLGCSEQTVSLWERYGKVPLWADKLLRMVYIARVQGDTTVKEAIDRLNFVDRVVNEKIMFHETLQQLDGLSGWRLIGCYDGRLAPLFSFNCSLKNLDRCLRNEAASDETGVFACKSIN